MSSEQVHVQVGRRAMRVEGEYWNAVSDTPIEKDEQAEIAAVQGLTVKLQPIGKHSHGIN